jgi:hypothetical protein
MSLGKTFPADDVAYENVEGLARGSDTCCIERVSLGRKPLVPISMMHRGVWSDEAGVRKLWSP